MSFLRLAGSIVLLVIAASILIAAIANAAEPTYQIQCTTTRMWVAEIPIFRSSFD